MDVNINVENVSGNMQTPPATDNKPFNLSGLTSLTTKLPSIADFLREARKSIRPWTEFLNWSNFKAVANPQRLSSRVIRNLAYFQSNYLFVFIILILYCLLTSPLILIALAGVFYACFKLKQLNQTFNVMGRPLDTNQQCILVNVASIPVLYLAGAGTALFWVLGASFFVISLHAGLYNIDAIVTEDTEGFLAETV